MTNNTYEELIHKPIIDCGFFIIWSNGHSNTSFERAFVSKNKNINILALQRYLKKLVKNKTIFTIDDIYECRCSEVVFWEYDPDTYEELILFIEIEKVRELRGMDDGE